MTSSPTLQDRVAFYGAAALGLRVLDARERTARRFGSDAQARWAQFAGALKDGDRLDTLLRDAAGTWGAAFSPSECFGFWGLADDEPFGPDWGGIDDHAATRLFSESTGQVTLDMVAAALGVQTGEVPVPPLTPATKPSSQVVQRWSPSPRRSQRTLRCHGPIKSSLSQSFRRPTACRPCGCPVGARGGTVLVHPTVDATTALRSAGFAHIDAAIVSPDAEPEAAAFARSVGGK